MPSTPKTLSGSHDPYAALRHSNYRYYAIGNFMAITADRMLATAVGYELWKRTHSATALGLWGLVLAAAFLLMALPGGHLADRYNRKFVILLSEIFLSLCALGLAWVSFHNAGLLPADWTVKCNHALEGIAGILEKHMSLLQGTKGPGYSFQDPSVPSIFFLLFCYGFCQSLSIPAKNALLPQLVPATHFSNAVMWGSQIFQIGSIIGPPITGVIIAAWGFPVAYLASVVCFLSFFTLLLSLVKSKETQATREPVTLQTLLAGVRFVRKTKIILATITLDLFAVLVGGATALLPMFADDILHVGSYGFGWLMAAPSIGALCMAVALTHLPPMKQAGRALLWSVAGFGIATIVFGLSQWFWLSMFMLFLTGALDNISVVIRATLVQVLTPNEMRGRVSAVNFMFIVASNELGGAESGFTAALFGPVLSVVAGGIGTVLVVLGVAWLWPEVAALGSLDSPKARPKPEDENEPAVL